MRLADPAAHGWRIPFVFGLAWLVVILALFWRLILLGEVLIPADIVLVLDPAFSQLASAGITPGNLLLSDQVNEMFPWRSFIWETLKAGDIPLWNPYAYGGMPLLANGQAAVFSPINLATLPLPVSTAFGVIVILRLWVTGALTWCYLRSLGASPLAAALGAVAFSFSGFVVVWLGAPPIAAVPFLPGMLWAVERLTHGGNRAGWAAALAGFMACQLLGGYIQSSIHITGLVTIYALVRIGRRRLPTRDGLRLLTWNGGALLLGTALAALTLLPQLELLFRSISWTARAAQTTGSSWLPDNLIVVLTSLTLVLPDVFGNQTYGPYLAFTTNYNEAIFYAGVAALILAVPAAFWLRSVAGWFWFIAGVISFAVAAHLPIFEIVYHLPVIGTVRHSLLRLVVALSIAVLAALAADRVARAPAAYRRYRRLALLTILGLAGLLLGLAVVILVWRDPVIALVNVMISAVGRRQAVPPELFGVLQDNLLGILLPWRSKLYLPLLGGLALLIVWSLAARRNWRPSSVLAAFLGVVLVEGFVFAYGYNPSVAGDPVLPTPPAIAWLEANDPDARLIVLGDALQPNLSMLWNLEDLRGKDPLVPSAIAVRLRSSPDLRPDAPQYINYTALDPRLAAEAGVGWAVYAPQQVGLERGVKRLPPGAPAFDGGGLVVVPTGAGGPRLLVVAGPAATPDAQSTGAATTLARNGQRETIRVDAPAGAWLLRRDNWDPGWQATVDGVDAPVVAANSTLWQAIAVPAGTSTVSIRYDPPAWRLGLVISATALLLWVGLVVLSRLQARHNGEPPSAT